MPWSHIDGLQGACGYTHRARDRKWVLQIEVQWFGGDKISRNVENVFDLMM